MSKHEPSVHMISPYCATAIAVPQAPSPGNSVPFLQLMSVSGPGFYVNGRDALLALRAAVDAALEPVDPNLNQGA